MTLVVALTPAGGFKPGNTKWALVNLTDFSQTELESQPGWLVCNGASLLRSGKYANLFAALGTAYGAADGTHFSLPDHRDGYNPIAMGASNFTARAARGGEYAHAVSGGEVPAHSHSFNDHMRNDPNWNSGNGYVVWNGYTSSQNPAAYVGGQTAAVTGGKGNGVSGDTHENMPPVLVVSCMLIKY